MIFELKIDSLSLFVEGRLRKIIYGNSLCLILAKYISVPICMWVLRNKVVLQSFN